MKRFLYYLISGALVLALGIFMIMKPAAFANIAVTIFAVYMIANGLRSLYYFIKLRKSARAIGITLSAKGLLNTIIGLAILVIALWKPESTLKALVYVAAAGFFIDALFDIIDLIIVRKYSILYTSFGIEAISSIVIGLILCLFPSAVGKISIYLIAGVVLIIGTIMISYGVHYLSLLRFKKKLEKTVKEADVEFEEKN